MAKLGINALSKRLKGLRKRYDKLHQLNLRATELHPEGAATVTRHRRIDGADNRLNRPQVGAQHTLFARNVAPDAVEKDVRLDTPHPVTVSKELLAQHGTQTFAESINLLAGAWIQFQVHDWFDHETSKDDFHRDGLAGPSALGKNIEAPVDTQGFPVYKNTKTHWWDGSQLYGSNESTTTRLRGPDGKLKLTTVNDNVLLPKAETHENNTDAEVIDDTGFNKNWWLGLSLLHTLFAQEHNAIATMLKAQDSTLSDDEIFKTARLINTALIAKIHTIEWTPALLDDEAVKLALRLDWWGIPPEIVSDVFAALSTEFEETINDDDALALERQQQTGNGSDLVNAIDQLFDPIRLDVFELLGDDNDLTTRPDENISVRERLRDRMKSGGQRMKDLLTSPGKVLEAFRKSDGYLDDILRATPTLLAGQTPHRIPNAPSLPSQKDEQHYAMTEEFVAVYRMHPLLPDKVKYIPIEGGASDEWDLQEVVFGKTRRIVENHDTADLLHSFGQQFAGALTLNNYPKALTEMRVSVDGRQDVFDVGAIDVLRDRERGIPRYKDFRRALRTFDNTTHSFADFLPVHDSLSAAEQEARTKLRQKLEAVYDNKFEDLDTVVGLLAEPPPEGFAFSDTAFEVFVLMAPRRLQCDRFFTASYNKETYTQAGLDWIDNNSMVDVLSRHHPRLCEELQRLDVANAFIPWTDKQRQRAFNQIPITLRKRN